MCSPTSTNIHDDDGEVDRARELMGVEEAEGEVEGEEKEGLGEDGVDVEDGVGVKVG